MALGNNLKKNKKTSGSKNKSNTEKHPQNVTTESQENQVVTEVRTAPLDEGNSEDLKDYYDHLETRDDQVLLIVFDVGEEKYALSIDQVQEVVKMPPIAYIPHVARYIRGVSNVRGTVYAILDLTVRFGLDVSIEDDSDDNHYAVVIQSDDYKMAVQIDSVPDTLIVDASDIEDSGHIAKHGNTEDVYIKGVVRNEDKLIIFIDILRLIKADEKI